jgi:hypothetical protein
MGVTGFPDIMESPVKNSGSNYLALVLVILQRKKLQDFGAYPAKTLRFSPRGKIGCRTLAGFKGAGFLLGTGSR